MNAKAMTEKYISRGLVYAVLLIAAAFFLTPLYVMVATSFKDAEQIRSGNLLSLPPYCSLRHGARSMGMF